MGRREALPTRDAIRSFFGDILHRSRADREHKGCMVVNSALELAPHDPQRERLSPEPFGASSYYS